MRENLFAWVKKGEIMPQVCGYNEFQKLFEKSANPQPLLAEVFDPLPVKFLATLGYTYSARRCLVARISPSNMSLQV